ncbi:uncharacterized protein LOC126922713 [Bombus affinis]|uniref:uncharacterized protein LOC126922713 n=1 Tax=Bombus affinis TaxID=309941 RepID=UPI0021B719A3|nr:uncharacterized protein LOC126922713 [Bombus affinis]
MWLRRKIEVNTVSCILRDYIILVCIVAKHTYQSPKSLMEIARVFQVLRKYWFVTFIPSCTILAICADLRHTYLWKKQLAAEGKLKSNI